MVRASDRPAAQALKLVIDPRLPSRQAIARAASVLKRGGLVAFPTDTLYALGADASNPSAVQRVFSAKGRSLTHPISLLVADLAMANQLVGEFPEPAACLAEHYWPGPLTLVLPALEGASPLLTAGTDRIGLRIPDAPTALALILRLGGPVTGTSANRSTGPEPRNADEVSRQLSGRLELILDGGALPPRSPSTVVDLTVSPPVIVREGLIRKTEIFKLLGIQSPARKAKSGRSGIRKAFGER